MKNTNLIESNRITKLCLFIAWKLNKSAILKITIGQESMVLSQWSRPLKRNSLKGKSLTLSVRKSPDHACSLCSRANISLQRRFLPPVRLAQILAGLWLSLVGFALVSLVFPTSSFLAVVSFLPICKMRFGLFFKANRRFQFKSFYLSYNVGSFFLLSSPLVLPFVLLWSEEIDLIFLSFSSL